MAGPFHKYKDDSFWRRIAMAMWDRPTDPQIFAGLEIDATAMEEVREQAMDELGVKLTPTHFVSKAMAVGISQYPEMNGILVRGNLHKRETVDIWFNVAFDDGDLFGAKVDDVESKSVVDVAEELNQGAEQIRSKDDDRLANYSTLSRLFPNFMLRFLLWLIDVLNFRLKIPLTWAGVERDPFGTAMVTNIGTFDLEQAFAPLVPTMRHPALVVVGRINERPVAEDGEVVVKPILPLSVTVDHRYLDGFQAAKMAHAFRGFLESKQALQAAVFDEPADGEAATAKATTAASE